MIFNNDSQVNRYCNSNKGSNSDANNNVNTDTDNNICDHFNARNFRTSFRDSLGAYIR